jgi:hypothetical protein
MRVAAADQDQMQADRSDLVREVLHGQADRVRRRLPRSSPALMRPTTARCWTSSSVSSRRTGRSCNRSGRAGCRCQAASFSAPPTA